MWCLPPLALVLLYAYIPILALYSKTYNILGINEQTSGLFRQNRELVYALYTNHYILLVDRYYDVHTHDACIARCGGMY